MIERLLDLDKLLLEFAAPAFSKIGAPARRVGKLLRALLLLNIKNVRSEKFLVDIELKHNLLYRWFVRLEKDETISDSFRVALVRLRARLASRLKHEQWQAFLAKTVEQALAQHRLLLSPAQPLTERAQAVVGSQITAAPASSSSFSDQTPAPPKPRPDTGPPKDRTEFTNWVDQYAQDWGLGPRELSLSADGEFHTGESLKHFEDRKWLLHVPVCEPTVAKGKLDHRYFSYFAEENIFVCHEGAELKRIGYDKQKQRTRYRAPAEACANCSTTNLCKGGEGPRKVSRSDFADQFARAKEQAKTDQHRDARWSQHVYGEGSFAHSNCNHGLDHARYYGQKKMLLQGYWTAAAMNLKKAFRFLQARLEASGPSTDPVPT